VLDFKAVNHEVKEMLPTVEKQVASQGSDIMKEGATDGKRFSQQPIFMIGDVQSCVNKKSQQIEGKQCM
jgi:hypothetical protein